MNLLLFVGIVAVVAICAIIMHRKIRELLKNKLSIDLSLSIFIKSVAGLSLVAIVYFVYLIVFGLGPSRNNKLDSELEQKKSINFTHQCDNSFSFHTGKKGDISIIGTDTISFINQSDNSYSLHTSRMLKNSEAALLKHSLEYLGIDKASTVFLYLKKEDTEDNYYASYNGVAIHRKVTNEQIIKNIIVELNSGMVINSKGNIITFLSKIEDIKNKYITNDNELFKKQLINALISFQKNHFPKARKAYYQNAKDELWEKDIEVSMSGKNITFTGYMFAKNQIIKDTYLEIKDEISKLRFKTVGFRAFDGDDKTYWETGSKDDSII